MKRCNNCGAQNKDGNMFCIQCGTPLPANDDGQQQGKTDFTEQLVMQAGSDDGQQQGKTDFTEQTVMQAGSDDGTQQGTEHATGKELGANEKNGTVGRILTVFLWIVAILHIAKAVSSLFMLVSGLMSLGGYHSYKAVAIARVLCGAMTMISCALLAYSLILFALFRKYEKNPVPDRNRNRFVTIVEASILRVIVAVVCLLYSYLVRALSTFSFWILTPQELIKTIIYTAVWLGIVFLFLMAEGNNPFEGATPIGFIDLNKSIFSQIVSDTQEMVNRRETKKQGTTAYGGLKTNRGVFKFVLFTVLTCGIYGWIFYYEIARDLNTICDGDDEHTSGLLALIGFSIITCGIYSIIWDYEFADRLADNAPRYGLQFRETGTTVLLWRLAGVIFCGAGPVIAMHIQIKNLNKLAAAYNKLHENGTPDLGEA